LYTICQQGFVSKNIERSIFENAILSSQVQAFPWIFYKILAFNFLLNLLASLPNLEFAYSASPILNDEVLLEFCCCCLF